MPKIPNFGLAFGFGIIGFGLAYTILTYLIGENRPRDLAIGAIIGGIAWLIATIKGRKDT